MTVTLNLGHKLALALTFLDTNGNPMLVPPVPDAPPTWTNTTPATETLAPSADGLTCAATNISLGTDTVSLSVVVGGITLLANLDVTVVDTPQVMKSIQITPTVT